MKENKCNGHCFLSKQLKKEAEKEKKETESLKEKQELVYVESTCQHYLITNYPVEKLNSLMLYHCGKPKSTELGIFRPPLA